MARSQLHVVEAFMRGEACNNPRRDAFHVIDRDGTAVIYSYAMAIAVRHPNGKIQWLLDPSNPPRGSATTSRHLRDCTALLPPFSDPSNRDQKTVDFSNQGQLPRI